jgi:hypothetical protein
MDVDMRAVSRFGAGLRNRAEGGGTIESAAAGFFDGAGVMMRLTGLRPMIAVDEFYKAQARGMQLEALAHSDAAAVYKAARKDGLDHNTAKEMSRAQYVKSRVSDTNFEAASEFGRMVTFMDDLPGILGKLQGFFSHPLMKIWVPFYKTPTQINRRVIERTPLALAFPQTWRKLFFAGGDQRREAIARITFSSGVGASLMYLASGAVSESFVITGYGPTNKKQRRSWLENHQPYSIGIKQEDGSWDWISYARYDPVGGVLALAADTAYTLRYMDDGDQEADVVMNLGISIMRYTSTTMPMMQFIGELMDIGGGPYQENQGLRVRQLFAKQLTEAGLIVGQSIATGGLGPSGLMAQAERIWDPEKRSSTPTVVYGHIPGVGMQPEIRAAMESLQYVQSRIPVLSGELEYELNNWAEPKPINNGGVWATFLPYRMINLPQSGVLNGELDHLGVGLARHPHNMGLPMIQLTAEQRNRYITLINDPMQSDLVQRLSEEWTIDMEFPGWDIKYDHIPSLAESLVLLIKNPEGGYNPHYFYKGTLASGERIPASTNDRLKLIRGRISQYRSRAKQLMLMEYPEIQAAVEGLKAYKDKHGRSPLFLYPARPEEVEEIRNRQQGAVDSLFED